MLIVGCGIISGSSPAVEAAARAQNQLDVARNRLLFHDVAASSVFLPPVSSIDLRPKFGDRAEAVVSAELRTEEDGGGRQGLARFRVRFPDDYGERKGSMEDEEHRISGGSLGEGILPWF